VLQEEYMQQLDAVAEYITEWGVVDTWVNFFVVDWNEQGHHHLPSGNTWKLCLLIESC
jgi:hypothetical protein